MNTQEKSQFEESYQAALAELAEKQRAIQRRQDQIEAEMRAKKSAEPPRQPPPEFAEIADFLETALRMASMHYFSHPKMARALEWLNLQRAVIAPPAPPAAESARAD